MMAALDVLLIVVVVAAFVAISAFVGLAVASDDSHRRYPGTKFDRFRDIAVMNVPAIPFLALLFASSISDLDDGRFFTPILALCAGFTLAGHFLPPVNRARERFRSAYSENPPWR